MEIAALELVL
ncbi:hypothetical protein FDECE_18245, partial [Fusarium decemcellulare]